MINYKRPQKLKKSDKIAALSNKQKFKRLLPLLIAAGILLALFVTLLIIRSNQAFAEFVSRNISRYLVNAAGFLSSLLPFSVFEWFVILAIAAGVTLLVLLIIGLFKKKFYKIFKGLLIVAVIALSFFAIYTLTAGTAYYRKPLPLPINNINYNKEYNGEKTIAVSEVFLDDFNALADKFDRDENGNVISPYTFKQLNSLLADEFKKLDDAEFGGYFYSYTPKVKTVLNSWFMTSTQITGITFVPFGEPNINSMPIDSSLPQVMAHEIAHAKGVMRENEANLISYYVLLNSENEYLRYCGYFSCFYSLTSAIKVSNNLKNEPVNAFTDKINESLFTEWTNDYKFWKDYVSPLQFFSDFLAKAGEFFNNIYLKLNGRSDGTDSYQNPSDSIDTGETVPDTGQIDPDTGEVIPGTEEKIYDPVYSEIHKIFFTLYENGASWLK